jgi:C4-dicarboxylate-specific signal transduction histidine kinase
VTGWPAEAIAAAPDLSGWSEPDRPSMSDMIAQARQTGTAAFDWRMRRPDGGWQWMRSSLRFLETNPDGSGLVVGYILNVTAEREAAARAGVAGRLASLGEMATGLAHELKQPLAIASMAAQNASRSLGRGDAAGVERRLATISTQMERGGTIIDHLRRFATGGDPGAPPGPVLLSAAVEGAMTLVGSTLTEAGIAVEVALDPPLLRVLGHLVPLEQVLLNLLTNARDAIAGLPPGAPRRIRLEAAKRDGRVALTLADTGGGIPAALLDRVFEPFLTTKGPDRGTGLGLSICLGLVTAMGGRITAANGTAGAVFTLDLPAAPEAGEEPGAPSLVTAP